MRTIDKEDYDIGGKLSGTLPYLRTMESSYINKQYGKWTVISTHPPRVFPSGQKHSQVLCRCSCDNATERAVMLRDLKNGKSTSCGCVLSAKTSARNRVHGLTGSPLYKVWKGMVRRCTDPNSNVWKWYGGKRPVPVTVCAEWLRDAEAFVRDMQPTYEPGFTLERRDSNGPYSPSNCYWTTIQAQQRNRSSNRIVVYDGVEQMCMAEAAERLGLNRHTLKVRLNRAAGYYLSEGGHTVEDIAGLLTYQFVDDNTGETFRLMASPERLDNILETNGRLKDWATGRRVVREMFPIDYTNADAEKEERIAASMEGRLDYSRF